MKKITLVFLLLASLSLSAQTYIDLNRFDGIKSQGATPSDLRMSVQELYGHDKQRVREYNDGKLRGRDKILNASYHIHRIIASGKILYGDPITRMVERIADTLLVDYPVLRKELRFYTIKSSDVNAFATGQGMVFVCTGLVSHVKDESQLAFIISHEIVHYLRKHSIEQISRRRHDSDDIDAETQEMRDFIKYHNRSRQMENEADSLGLTMFYLKSPYSKNVTEGVFDVLQYGYLPFDERPFDTVFFNTPYYKIPPDCFMEHVDSISTRDDYNDSLSTHPNIKKRRLATAKITAGAMGGNRFVTMTEDEFNNIRALARFECVRQSIINADYARAFYDAYLLRSLYPNNEYVDLALCQALYGMSKHKSYTNTSTTVGDFKNFEGEVQQCYYLFRRMKREDLALVTARYLWQASKKHPSNVQIVNMRDDIFADLASVYKLTPDYFSSEPPAIVVQDTATAKLSRYERLKQKKHNKTSVDVQQYAFTDLLMNDISFNEYINNAVKPLVSSTSVSTSTSTSNKQLIYYPSYYVISKSSGEQNIMKSVTGGERLRVDVVDAAAACGIASVDFSDESLRDILTSERYNEWVEINEWANEFWQTRGDFDMLFSVQPQMNRIAKKYDVSSVNVSNVMNRENLHASNTNMLWLVWLIPATPFVFNSLFGHREATMVNSLQVDALSGRKMSKHTFTYTLSDERSRVRSALYDHYSNLDNDTASGVPGYLGKRFTLALSPSFGIGPVGNASYDGKSSILRSGFLSLALATDIEFVATRKGSIHLTAEFSPSSATEPTTTGKNELYDVNFMTFHMGWRGYRYPAPLGYYYQFGPSLCIANIFADPLPRTDYDNSRVIGGLHLQFGRNHIFGDRVLFSYYVRYSLMAVSGLIDDGKKDAVDINAFSYNVFRLGLSVGLLPF